MFPAIPRKVIEEISESSNFRQESPSTVRRPRRRLGKGRRTKKKYDLQEISAALESGMSAREIVGRFGISAPYLWVLRCKLLGHAHGTRQSFHRQTKSFKCVNRSMKEERPGDCGAIGLSPQNGSQVSERDGQSMIKTFYFDSESVRRLPFEFPGDGRALEAAARLDDFGLSLVNNQKEFEDLCRDISNHILTARELGDGFWIIVHHRLESLPETSAESCAGLWSPAVLRAVRCGKGAENSGDTSKSTAGSPRSPAKTTRTTRIFSLGISA